MKDEGQCIAEDLNVFLAHVKLFDLKFCKVTLKQKSDLRHCNKA